MQTIRVLRGVDTLQDGVRVDPARQWQLHDVARAGGVGVELINRSLHLLLRRVGGQIHADRLGADLGAVAVLARNVGDRAGVLAHQDRPEARDDPDLAQAIHAFLELSLDSCGGRRVHQEPARIPPREPSLLESRVQGVLVRKLLDAGTQGIHLNIAARRALRQRRTDDVCDLREVLGIETARREGGGTDAQARGDGRRTRVQRAPRCG